MNLSIHWLKEPNETYISGELGRDLNYCWHQENLTYFVGFKRKADRKRGFRVDLCDKKKGQHLNLVQVQQLFPGHDSKA